MKTRNIRSKTAPLPCLLLPPSGTTKVHETQLVRHGMMMVGETSSGKSTNVAVLANALGRLYADGVQDRDGFYKQVDRLLLNPKSITAGELYTPQTREQYTGGEGGVTEGRGKY